MTARTDTARAIETCGVVAVIRLSDASKLGAVVEALAAGGVRALEVTMTVPGAIQLIERLAPTLPKEFVLGAGTAGVADIDKGCKLGLSHPMGPLELADFIGLDTCLDIVHVLYESTGDPKYRPAPILRKYVEAGWLGRKSGRGFYDYSGAEPIPTR